ncbi:MAG: mandelate racemase/muconate lactonizing enzyme family protein [Candidatus Thorarchaeota archaeon]
MSKIVSVKTEQIQTMLAGNDFITTYGKEPTTRYHVIVRIESDNGVFGTGEACPLPFTEDDDPIQIQNQIDNQLGPFLIDRDPFDKGVLEDLTNQFPDVGGTARAGVDLALYDLVGKIREVPVYEYLGGLVRESVEIAAVLGIGSPECIANEALEEIEQGMKSVKIKVGLDVDRDIETLKIVRERVGDSARIRADANTGYTINQAQRFLEVAEEMNLEYLEQPLATNDYEGFSRLREESSVPLMADESLYTYEDALKLIEYEAVDLFGMKLIKHGGIFQAGRIAKLAEESGIECVMISPWETQIGVSAAVHLILSGSNFNHPHELAPGSLRDDPFKGLEVDNGIYLPPKGMGLGVF